MKLVSATSATTTMLSRLSAIRRLPRYPRTFAVRYYTDGRSEGSVAQSQGFKYISTQAYPPEKLFD